MRYSTKKELMDAVVTGAIRFFAYKLVEKLFDLAIRQL